jgi:hypothetical protein
MTITFDNESNTSVITFGDGFFVGGQTTGYNGNGAALATNEVNGNSIKLYSLKALTKLGTNHITLYKSDEQNLNKHTRFICDLTIVAITIKSDIYNWRKSLGNE